MVTTQRTRIVASLAPGDDDDNQAQERGSGGDGGGGGGSSGSYVVVAIFVVFGVIGAAAFLKHRQRYRKFCPQLYGAPGADGAIRGAVSTTPAAGGARSSAFSMQRSSQSMGSAASVGSALSLAAAASSAHGNRSPVGGAASARSVGSSASIAQKPPGR